MTQYVGADQRNLYSTEQCNSMLPTESESESESFYSVILQTQETSAKTYLVAVAEVTWKKNVAPYTRAYTYRARYEGGGGSAILSRSKSYHI